MNEEAEKVHREETGRQTALPMTVTSESLIVDGSDRHFRELIDNLLVLSGQLQWLRSVLAQQLGVSEPQYRMLLTIARLQDEMNVSVSELATRMRVTGAFVTVEIGKLSRMGLVEKEKDPTDGRGVVIRLSNEGHRALVDFAEGPQTINDELFKGFSREDFNSLRSLVGRLVENGERAERIGRALYDTGDVRNFSSRGA